MTKFLNWFLQLFVPYALLICGFMVMRGGENKSRADKGFDIGFDACILGFGIAAVFQANAAVIPLAIGGPFIGMFFHLNRSGFSAQTKARVAIIASTLIFGANTSLVTWLNEASVRPTIIWGLVAWLVPCAFFFFVV